MHHPHLRNLATDQGSTAPRWNPEYRSPRSAVSGSHDMDLCPNDRLVTFLAQSPDLGDGRRCAWETARGEHQRRPRLDQFGATQTGYGRAGVLDFAATFPNRQPSALSTLGDRNRRMWLCNLRI